jgi:hypothetical protein
MLLALSLTAQQVCKLASAEPCSADERTERETTEGKVQITLARDYCPARLPGEASPGR